MKLNIGKILYDIGQMWCGSDKKPSIRRVLGTYLVIHGGIMLATAGGPISENWWHIAWAFRGAIAIVGGLFLFGVITMQHVKSLVKKD